MKSIWLLLVVVCAGCGAKDAASRPDSYPAAPRSDQLSIEGAGNRSGESLGTPR